MVEKTYSYESRTACDGKQLLIEVTGCNHSDDQDFLFYDKSDMEELMSLKKNKKLDIELKKTNDIDSQYTSIYSWKWSQQTPSCNVWLEVKAKNGSIKLPLFNNVSATERRKKVAQDYQLQSIIPLTFFTMNNGVEKRDAHKVPVRDGYIYIVYQGKIWRELVVMTDANGKASFQDIDLYSYRKARDKPFILNKNREVTGLPLETIWIPSNVNGSSPQVLMAYSEVPWSAARLNFLEANPAEINKRFSRIPHRLDLSTDYHPMRPRDLGTEMMLGNPYEYNQDLTGSLLTNTFKNAQKDIQNSDHKTIPKVKDRQFKAHVDVLAAVLADKAQKDSDNKKIVDFSGEWKIAPETVDDWLSTAKEHYYRVLTLPDPIQNLRQIEAVNQYAQLYYQQLIKLASFQEYYHSAHLATKIIFPEKLGEQKNKLHEHLDLLYRGKNTPFNLSLRIDERLACRKQITKLQKDLYIQMSDSYLPIVLKDITSLDDANGLGASILINRCNHALLFNAINSDDLLLPSEKKELTNDYDNWLYHLFIDSPLSKVIFPLENTINQSGSYQQPKPYNDGTGLLTREHLSQWANDNLLLKSDDIIQIDAQIIPLKVSEISTQKADKSTPNENSFSQIRRISSVINTILSSYAEHRIRLIKELNEKTIDLKFTSIYEKELSTTKVLASKVFGSLEFIEANKINTVSGVIIGVSRNSHAEEGTIWVNRSPYKYNNTARINSFGTGKINGDVAFDTAKNRISAGELGTYSQSKNVSFVVLKDPDKDTVKYLNSNSQIRHEVRTGKISAESAYERLNVPIFIMGIELWNLKNALSGANHNRAIFSILTIISASLDLGIAATAVHNLFAQKSLKLGILSKSILEGSGKKVVFLSGREFFSKQIGRFTIRIALAKGISVFEFANGAAGLLTVVIASWQMIDLLRAQDLDAAIGMAMVAVGSLIASLSAIFLSSSEVLAIGPIGWLGLAISLIGAAIVYYFTDTEIEKWLKLGPFGENPSSDEQYRYLQDPKLAFNQLLNIFLSFRVIVYPIDKLPKKYFNKEKMKGLGITHAVYVSCNIPQLIKISEKNKYRFFAKEALDTFYRKVQKDNPSYYEGYPINRINNEKQNYKLFSTIKTKDINPVADYDTIDGKIYLFSTDFVSSEKLMPDRHHIGGDIEGYYVNKVSIHARAQLAIGDLIFPVPLIGNYMDVQNDLRSGKLAIDKPKFNASDDAYWQKSVNVIEIEND